MAFTYRPHRGLLADAMAEAQTFETWDDLTAFLVSVKEGTAPDDFTAEAYSDRDDRIGWVDIWIVMRHRSGPVGFTNGYPGNPLVPWVPSAAALTNGRKA